MKKIISKDEFDIIITLTTESILKELGTDTDFFCIGIRTRGVYLAQRIIQKIKKINPKITTHLGILDINLYRDDLETNNAHPVINETLMDFDINNKKIFLFDDVLYTGRTIRSALNEISDFGRPKFVRLVVFIDRGLRELPIQPDYTGKKIDSIEGDKIKVRFKESDGKDEVLFL